MATPGATTRQDLASALSATEVATYAKTWNMPEDQVVLWLEQHPKNWMVRNAAVLAGVKITPAIAARLFPWLSRDDATNISLLVRAGALGDLNMELIVLWAQGGVLKSVAAEGKRGARSPAVSHNAWVTKARSWIAAANGDEHLAALAAAAGVSANELREMVAANTVSKTSMETLAALRQPPAGQEGAM